MSETKLTGDHIATLGLADWRTLQSKLHARFRTGDFATGLDLVNAIGAVAEEMNHHPDLDLRYTHLQVALFSHDVGAKTQRDVDLARRISELAAERGVVAEPQGLTLVEAGLDTWATAEVLPFWRALLGLPETDGEEVVDPLGFVSTVWFQDTDAHDTPRQRWHFDVWVAPDEADARIAAALEAGGTVVDDSHAPSFTVLADPQDNRACICTHAGR
ncbi:4a-hydroxytetrahydrobiopterin dehydratase [Nocardioides terrisoli]|uniref:4a-hydroxytetrahydrobiopterin dehydratase n=1 Tax=Nocardioides terrisoli TaxID=3388267 RepID=UPI00287BA491|nr:4a-hydroxytetrahydrobiopterin dehydratase [Nocardioides marmorisolisilvae]